MIVNVSTDTIDNETIIRIRCQDNGKWCGVGFGSNKMKNTYAIVMLGSDAIQERKLLNHAMGTTLTSSFTSSSVVTTDYRYLTVTRPTIGITSNHYTFPTTYANIKLIHARSTSTSALVFHG